jgi:hypothetical protein
MEGLSSDRVVGAREHGEQLPQGCGTRFGPYPSSANLTPARLPWSRFQVGSLQGYHKAYTFWAGMVVKTKKKIGQLFAAAKSLRVGMLVQHAWAHAQTPVCQMEWENPLALECLCPEHPHARPLQLLTTRSSHDRPRACWSPSTS